MARCRRAMMSALAVHCLLAALGCATAAPTPATPPTAAAAAAPTELLLNREGAGGRLLHHPRHAPPAFTWRPPHGLPCGSRQVAYQLRLADATGDLVLDTGRVASAESVSVALPPAALRALAPPSGEEGGLRAGRHYSWSVKVWLTDPDPAAEGACESESAWSAPAAFRTALWDGFAPQTHAIWLPSKASYALFRKEIAVPKGATNATAYVTALVSGGKQKLLGAYRLFVNGASAGIGPGRGDCSLQYTGAAADKSLCTEYDTIDLSPHLPASGGTMALGIQSYHMSGAGAVQLQLHFESASGDLLQVGTDAQWLSHDATAFFGPSGATGGYKAPRENQNAQHSPGAWQEASYKPPAGITWAPSVVQSDFPSNVTAKTGLPLSITTGVKVPVLMEVEGSAEPLFFFDQSSDVMGGIHLEVPAGGAKGFKYAEVTLSEELAGPYGSGQLLYPMRTGNTYRYTFTLDAARRSVYDIHEYALYRCECSNGQLGSLCSRGSDDHPCCNRRHAALHQHAVVRAGGTAAAIRRTWLRLGGGAREGDAGVHGAQRDHSQHFLRKLRAADGQVLHRRLAEHVPEIEMRREQLGRGLREAVCGQEAVHVRPGAVALQGLRPLPAGRRPM